MGFTGQRETGSEDSTSKRSVAGVLKGSTEEQGVLEGNLVHRERFGLKTQEVSEYKALGGVRGKDGQNHHLCTPTEETPDAHKLKTQ